MEAEADDTSPDSPARRVLLKQERLIGWEIADKRASLSLKVLSATLGMAAAVALAVMAGQASQYRGLVVEPFSVPPELEQRGLTGKVVAGLLLDDLNRMQAATNSVRAANSYANDWNEEARLEIPQTGISIGDLRRLLVDWLGEKTVIEGQAYRGADGTLVVSARAGAVAGPGRRGPDANLEALIQAVAEDIYATTQPYRYASFLRSQGRFGDAEAILRSQLATPSPTERAWTYVGLARSVVDREGDRVRLEMNRKAFALEPDLTLAWSNAADHATALGYPQVALGYRLRALRALGGPRHGLIAEDQGDGFERARRSEIAGLRGDAHAVFLYGQWLLRNGLDAGSTVTLGAAVSISRLGVHQPSAAHAALFDPELEGRSSARNLASARAIGRLLIAEEREDWPAVVREAEAMASPIQSRPGLSDAHYATIAPRAAVARARMGDLAGARALLAASPADSYAVMQARGQVATLLKAWPESDRFYAEAVRRNPDIAQAYPAWGRTFLDRGRPDEAMTRMQAAHKRFPKSADVLVVWGEALLAQGDGRGAAGRFAAAAKFTPNWGRLHLKWAKALAAQGKIEEARAHRAMAARLDLTLAERAELSAWRL